jgi:LPS-assembly protein
MPRCIFRAPILYSPWLSFSLNNERKSGLLTPTAGSTSQGGAEFTQPFYWNIAPNMDATIAPRIMAKRGTCGRASTATCSRLQRDHRGPVPPEDKLLHRRHRTTPSATRRAFGYGFSGSLALNGASDDTYFSDLSSGSSVIAQTNLLRQGTLSYSGGWWSANLLAQSYQTLQDPLAAAGAEPYRRLPQVTVDAARGDLPLGMNIRVSRRAREFPQPRLDNQGRRFTGLYPQLSLPLQTEVLSMTPKIGLHSTQLHLDPVQAAGVIQAKLTRNGAHVQPGFVGNLRTRFRGRVRR